MRLRAAREQSGKTQAQVAKETGVNTRLYQYYEAGEKKPGVDTAIWAAQWKTSSARQRRKNTRRAATRQEKHSIFDVSGQEGNGRRTEHEETPAKASNDG